MAVALCPTVSAANEFNTYVGDANDYHVSRIIADGLGNTYLAGSRALSTQSSEIVLMKLAPAGKVVLFTTLSGKGNDMATALTLDSAGNIYVAGTTTSVNLPL